MRRFTRLIGALALLAAGLGLSTGCTSWEDQEAIRVDIPASYSPVTMVTNRNNPVQIVQFARTLSQTGRHREAAGIYLDAATRFQSVGGKFEFDCRKEAVREYWMTGDFVRARSLLNDLEAEQDIYRRTSEEKGLKQLRSLLNNGQLAESK